MLLASGELSMYLHLAYIKYEIIQASLALIVCFLSIATQKSMIFITSSCQYDNCVVLQSEFNMHLEFVIRMTRKRR